MIEITDNRGNVLASVDGHTLEGADFSGRNLEGAQLSGCHLRRIMLRGAKLNRTDLRGAVLCDANLQGADLGSANLRGADLEGANLRGVKADSANFTEARLEDADLSGGSFIRAYFNDAFYSAGTRPNALGMKDSYGVSNFHKGYRSRRQTHLGFWERTFGPKEPYLADAVLRCDLYRAEKLLKKGANPDTPGDIGAGTVLHATIRYRDDQMMDLLIKYGANIEARGAKNSTPIQFAIEEGNGPAVLALLRAGADTKVVTEGGRDLLQLARFYRQEGMADVFSRLAGMDRRDL